MSYGIGVAAGILIVVALSIITNIVKEFFKEDL